MQKHCFYNWRFSLGFYMEMPNVKIYYEMMDEFFVIARQDMPTFCLYWTTKWHKRGIGTLIAIWLGEKIQ